MATGCLSTFMVLQLEEFRPKVGDMVVFKAGSQEADAWQLLVPATIMSPSGVAMGTCSLNPDVMATTGGSLVVEQRQDAPALLYHVRWVGKQTAVGPENCGRDSLLALSRTDLQRVANAAGGFGIGNKGVVR